jgi:hypothetical protein
VAVDVFLDN